MSSNLYWRPSENYGKSLPTDLKFALREQFGEPIKVTLSEVDISFLRGLKIGGMKSAQTLIDAIEKHERIDVEEKY